MSDKGKTIKSVAKACQLLKEAADMGPFSLAEMARALDEPTSSVDRLLGTLMEAGFVERRGTSFQVGKEAARIWSAYCLGLQRRIAKAKRDLTDVQVPAPQQLTYGINPEEWL